MAPLADPLNGGRASLNPLPHENLLTTLAEVAAAFVGFSIIAGILRGGVRRFHLMRDVAEIGLLAIGGSFLPLAIHAYGASPEATWRIASAAYIVLGVIGLGIAIRRRRKLDPEEFRSEPFRNAVNGVLNLVGFGLLVFNLVLGGPGSGARYTTAVLLLLAIAGIQFLAAAFSVAPDPPAV